MKHRTLLLAIALLAAMLVAGVGPARASEVALQRYTFVAPHMGTLFQIALYATDGGQAQAAADRAFARVAELDRVMSDYNPDSELSRLCRQPAGTPVTVSTELFDVLQRSQQISALSAGGFDITLGPHTQLWRESRRTRQLPSARARAIAARAVGTDKLLLDHAKRTVTLAVPGMRLDLGGIAKGYAADQALAVLTRAGFVRVMVAASGDLALGAPPPGASGWRVEVAPFTGVEQAGRAPTVLVAAHVGISTSADSEQFVPIGGRRYSHIVDPKTGVGLTRAVGVTVIAGDATRADALATAASVLTPEDARKLVARLDEPVRMIVQQRGGAGAIDVEVFGVAPAGLQAGVQ